MRLAAPLASFERMKRALFLVAYILLAEMADPRPFHNSWVARLAVLLLIVEVTRQFMQYRTEVSMGAVVRRRALRARWEYQKNKLSGDARYRARRFALIMAGVAAWGFVLDAFTDRCEGAYQCVMLAPRMGIELLPMALQIAFYIAMGIFQFAVLLYAMTKVGFVKIVPPGTVPETFDDVFGQDDARDKMMEQVDLLDDDMKIAEAGGYMPKGVLLWGPPGTGKTLLAKAAANASTKPLILVPPGAFASTFVGINFLKVFMLFRIIRKLSIRHDGVIVFIDEIDSLGHRGGEVAGMSMPEAMPPACSTFPARWDPYETTFVNSGGQMGTLEAFLAAMDGMEEPRGMLNRLMALAGLKPIQPPVYRYLMIGATNRPTAIDPALLRAGRLGRRIMVDYPKYEGRLATYDGYLGKIEHSLTRTQVEWMARNHHRGTGAEIKDAVNEAVLVTFRDGREEEGIVTFHDISSATLWKKYGESQGTFELERNIWSVSVHEAGHAVALHYLLRDRAQIWFASIEQRGQTGGMVVPSPLDDDWKEMADEMAAGIQISLASRVAERMIFGQASNGHGGDGPAATAAAEKFVLQGHHKTVGFNVRHHPELMVEHTEEVLQHQEKLVAKLLGPKQKQLELVAKLLERDKTVPGDKIHAMLDWWDERYPT